MTTDEAKEYLIKNTHFNEEDFTRASHDDVSCGLAEKDEWVHEYTTQTWEGPIEGEMKTAIELAKDHKFWNDPEQVRAYEDHMIEQIYK